MHLVKIGCLHVLNHSPYFFNPPNRRSATRASKIVQHAGAWSSRVKVLVGEIYYTPLYFLRNQAIVFSDGVIRKALPRHADNAIRYVGLYEGLTPHCMDCSGL